MSSDKGFRTMSALVEALRKAEEGLRIGNLSLDGLDRATDDAREFHERLVVLRHKAREQAQSRPVPQAAPAAEPVAPAQEAPPEAPAAAIRLDTKPPDSRQTSLIEAIAEKEEEPVMKTAAEYLKDAASPKKAPESVAEKMGKAHINELGKAISLSHKFWFTAELFGGDAKAYEAGIARIDAATDLDSAQDYLDNEVLAKLKKAADPEALETFTELIQRRFH